MTTKMLRLAAVASACLIQPEEAKADDPAKYTGGTTLLANTWLPYPLADYASGMSYSLTSWTRESGWATADDDFAAGLDTIIMDQAQCVYYTRFGATVVETPPQTVVAPSCTDWPPLWSTEIPSTTKMDVYIASSVGVNRIDFHDGSGTFGRQETCPTAGTLQQTMTLSSADAIKFYFSLNDDIDSDSEQWWMLKMVQHGSVFSDDNNVFGDHPHHNGFVRLDLNHDTSAVNLVGFQIEGHGTQTTSGANFMGLYYRIINCASVPACDDTTFLTGLTLVTADMDTVTKVHQHNLSIDASASCIQLRPAHMTVSHDYTGSNDIVATVSQTTSGSYVDLTIDVSHTTALPQGTVVTFTLNFGLDYVTTPPSAQVLALVFGCTKNSITFTSSVTSPLVLTENDALQNIAVPTIALDVSVAACWNLQYSIDETTSGPLLSSMTGAGTTITLDSSSAATNFVVPDLTGVFDAYYDFTYTVQDTISPSVSNSISFQVYVQYADPCMLPNSLTSPGDFASGLGYIVTKPTVQWTLNSFTVDPAGCPIVYTMSASPSDITAAPALTFDPSLLTLNLQTDDHSLTLATTPWYILYTVSITATVNLVSTTETIQLTVSHPCSNALSNALNQADGSVQYDLRSGQQSFDLNNYAWSTLGYCGDFVFTQTGGSAHASYQQDSTTMQLLVDSFVKADSGVSLALTFDAQLLEYPGMGTTSFTLTLNLVDPDPCYWPDSVTSSGLDDQLYTLYDASLIYSMDVILTDPTPCPIVYTFSVSPQGRGLETQLVLGQNTGLFQLYSEDLGLTTKGAPYYVDYTITVTGTVGISSVVDSFNLRIDLPCAFLDVFESSGTLSTQDYFIGLPALDYIIDPFVIEPSQCELVYSFTAENQVGSSNEIESSLVFDSDARKFRLQNPTDVEGLSSTVAPYFKEYFVTVKAQARVDYIEDTFTIRIHNPCADPKYSQIIAPKAQQITYTIGQGILTETIPDNFGTSLSFCGTVSTRVINPNQAVISALASGESTSADTLIIFTNDEFLTDTNEVIKVESYLTDYPQIAGKPLPIVLSFVEGTCQAGIITPGQIIDFTNLIGQSEAEMPLPKFTNQNAVFCPLSQWKYVLEVLDQTPSTVDAEDYFSFDANLLKLINNVAEISSDKDESPKKASFIVALTGTSETFSGEQIKHKLLFSIDFVEEEERKPQPILKPYIKNIDSSGNVVVKFNSIMAALKKSNSTDDTAGEAAQNPKLRSLQSDEEQELEFNEDGDMAIIRGSFRNETKLTLEQPLQIYVETLDFENAEKLAFGFDMVGYANSELQLKLYFENPGYVSQSTEKDVLVVRFNDTEVFKDVNGNTIGEDAAQISKPIRAQLEPEVADAISSGANVLATTIGLSMLASGAMSFLMNSSASLMVSLVKQLQIVMHMLLMKTIIAANASLMFGHLVGILTFDPIDVTEQLQSLFRLDGRQVENERLPELEYESPYLLLNMGSMVLLLAVFLAVLLFFLFLAIVCCCRKPRDYGKKQVRSIFWNGVLGFMDSGFFVFIFGAQINIKELVLDEDSDENSEWSRLLSWLVLVICGVYMLSLLYITTRSKEHLQTEKAVEKYGYVYDSINLKPHKSRWGLSHPVLFQLRVLLLSLVLLRLDNFLVGQCLVISNTTIMVMSVDGMMPFKELSQNKFEILGEFVILLTMDAMMASSDPKVSNFSRELIGWMIIAVLGLLILVSQIFIHAQNVVQVKNWCKRKKHLRRLQKKKREHELKTLAKPTDSDHEAKVLPAIQEDASKEEADSVEQNEERGRRKRIKIDKKEKKRKDKKAKKAEKAEKKDRQQNDDIESSRCNMCAQLSNKCLLCQLDEVNAKDLCQDEKKRSNRPESPTSMATAENSQKLIAPYVVTISTNPPQRNSSELLKDFQGNMGKLFQPAGNKEQSHSQKTLQESEESAQIMGPRPAGRGVKRSQFHGRDVKLVDQASDEMASTEQIQQKSKKPLQVPETIGKLTSFQVIRDRHDHSVSQFQQRGQLLLEEALMLIGQTAQDAQKIETKDRKTSSMDLVTGFQKSDLV